MQHLNLISLRCIAQMAAFAVVFGFSTHVFATTYTVMNTNNSGSGSLRDAITLANANAGPDSIIFAIPNSDPNCAIPAGDVDRICTIRPLTPLPTITDTISIDGSIPERRPILLGEHIPGSVKTPNIDATLRPGIEISGNLAATGNGITLANSNGHYIRGLILNQWRFGITVVGTTVSNNGIYGENVSNTVIEGNYLGTDATGKLASSITVPNYGNALAGIAFNAFGQGANIRIGGFENNQRNLSSNNNSSVVAEGTGIILLSTSNSQIIGNLTGSDVTGEKALGNRLENIDIRGFARNTFKVMDNNRIDSNLAVASVSRSGIRLLGRSPSDPVTNTVVVNNIAGISLLTGTPLPNFQGGFGIVDSVSGSRVGFDVVGGKVVPMPNVFASNNLYGIGVTSQAAGATFPRGVPINNAFLYNLIFNNLAIAIDLTADNIFAGDGVTPNDPPSNLDADGTSPLAANHYQNFPVLDVNRSFANPALVKLYGSLDSEANTSYLVQVFGDIQSFCAPTTMPYPINPACVSAKPFLASQARTFLGEFVVKTNSNGHADFKEMLKDGVTTAAFISVTATKVDATSGLPIETSEFSEAIDLLHKGSTNAYGNAAGAAGGGTPDCDITNPFGCF